MTDNPTGSTGSPPATTGISVMRPVPGTLSVADLAGSRLDDLDYQPPSADELRELARYLTLGLANLIDTWEDRPEGPLRLPKGRVRAARTCPAQVLAELTANPMNIQLAIGTVCDTAAGVLAVHPRFSAADGWYQSLVPALEAEHPKVNRFLAELNGLDREEVLHKIDELCLPLPDLVGDLRPLQPVTHQRMAARLERLDQHEHVDAEPLDVALTGEADIMAGNDVRVVVEVKSGAISTRVVDELSHYGLILALQNERRTRSPGPTAGRVSPPVLGCALTLGDLAVTPVPFTIEVLEGAANRVLEAVDQLINVDQAVATLQPVPTRPGPYCRWCPRLSQCPDGVTRVEAEDD